MEAEGFSGFGGDKGGFCRKMVVWVRRSDDDIGKAMASHFSKI